jgi:hypothetical protein
MRMQRSKRQRVVALCSSVAAMSATIPVLAHSHQVVMAFMLVFEVVLLALAFRLLYEAKREC